MKGLNHLGYSDTQTLSLGNREPQHVDPTNQLPLGSFSTRAGRGILTKKNDEKNNDAFPPVVEGTSPILPRMWRMSVFYVTW